VLSNAFGEDLVLFRPTLFSGGLGYALAFGGCKRISPSATTLQAAPTAQLNSCGVFAFILGIRTGYILGLPGQNIAYQLAELNGIARALESFGCHAGIMAWKARWFKGASRAPDFKLYHYRSALLDQLPIDDPDGSIIPYRRTVFELPEEPPAHAPYLGAIYLMHTPNLAAPLIVRSMQL
jgi:hypothetical protein